MTRSIAYPFGSASEACKWVLLWICALVIKGLNAQSLYETLPGGTVVGPTAEFQLIWAQPGADCVNYRNQGSVGLRIDHDHQDYFVPKDYEVTLSVTIRSYGDYAPPYNNPVPPYSVPLVLHVSHRPDADLTPIPGRDHCNDQDVYRIDATHDFTVTLLGVNEIDLNGNATPLTALPPHVFVEGILYHDHHCPMDLNTAPVITAQQVRECTGNDPFEVKLNWGYIDNADEFELEWTYVDDFAYDAQSNLLSQVTDLNALSYDFRNSATRIVTSATDDANDQEYTIPLVFDRGWVVFRVRGVSRDPAQPDRNVFGAWSLPESGTVGNAQTASHAVAVPGHDAKKPWSYSASYAEGGKRKEVVNYADGTQRPRQTVTRLNTDGIAVVGNTVYDRHGRAAITTLPTPIVKDQCTQLNNWAPLRHYAGMVEVAPGNQLDWRDFDKDDAGGACEPTAAPAVGGLVDYYYSQNYALDAGDPQLLLEPRPFIPNSGGYAYQQVEYTPDGSGRVRRQGGPGGAFQLLPGDHVTSFIYGKPDQPSLDRLFGPEAGYDGHYQKVTTTDANGQVSHAYLDISGRTVATSISGHAPDNLVALSPPGALTTHTVNMMPTDLAGNILGNTVDAGEREVRFNTTFTVPREDIYQFNYDVLALPQVPFTCAPLSVGCFDCVYTLDIRIVDQCQAVVWSHGALLGDFDEQNGTVNFVCQNVDPGQISATVTLPAGEYTISRVFSLHEVARQRYLDQVIATCVTPEDDLITDAVNDVDVSDCEITCDECLAALGTLAQFMTYGLGNEADYEAARRECTEPCEIFTWCRTATDAMIRDVSPGGQYGRVRDAQDNWLTNIWDGASVFNENNSLKRRYNPSAGQWDYPVSDFDEGHWRFPFLYQNGGFVPGYYDANGNRALVPVEYVSGQSTCIPMVLLPLHGANGSLVEINGEWFAYPELLEDRRDFVDRWQESWGRSLLYLHPEFCYYKHCIGYDVKVLPADVRTSDDFDIWLMGIESFDDALAAGLLQEVVVPPLDPDHPYNYYTANWTDANTGWPNPAAAIVDPYVQHAMDGATAQQDLRDAWAEGLNLNVSTINPNWLDLPSFACYRTRCGGQFGYVTGMVNSAGNDIDCHGFGGLITGVSQQIMDEIRNEEWIALRSAYLERKYKVQKAAMDALVQTCDCPGVNFCITKNAWVPYYFGFPEGQCQPCNFGRWLFHGKDARFADPKVVGLNAPSGNTAAYQLYLMTGKCPAAMAFESLLNELAMDGDLLYHNYPIDGSAAFSGLYSALTDLEHPGPVPACTMNPSPGAVFTATELTIPIGCPDAAWNCSIHLVSATPIDWQLVTQLVGLDDVQPDPNGPPGSSTFTIYAQFDGDLVPLTGTTCWDIANCLFEDVCEPNAVGRSIADVLAVCADQSDLTSNQNQHIPFTDPLYGPWISPALQEVVDPTGTLGHFTLKWVPGPPPDGPAFYFIGDDGVQATEPLVKLSLTGSSDPAFDIANTSHWQNVASVRDFRNSHQNQFHMDVWDANDVRLATVTGEAWLRPDQIDPTLVPLPLGACGPPVNPYCQNNEQLITTALYAVLAERFQHYWGGPVLNAATPTSVIPFDVFKSPMMTPLLENYLAQLFQLEPDPITGHFESTAEYSDGVANINLFGAGIIQIEWDPTGGLFNTITEVIGPDPFPANDDGPFSEMTTRANMDDGNGGVYTIQLAFRNSQNDLRPCMECPPTEPDPQQGAPYGTSPVNDCGSGLPPWATMPLGDDVCETMWPRWSGFFVDGTPTGDPDIVTQINGWNWFDDHAGNDLPLLTTQFPTYASLEASGMCRCVYSYFEEYISNTYGPPGLLATDPQASSPPLSINEYCAMQEEGCIDQYNAYLAATDAFNALVQAPVVPLGYVPCSEFTAQGYCHCVPEYVATINVLLQDGVLTWHEVDETAPLIYELSKFCAMPVPCDQPPPFNIPNIPVVEDTTCQEDLAINATYNAMVEYDHLVNTISTDFYNAYDNACLTGVKDLLTRIHDDIANAEEQFTLYYYDRAGNLVRTVPPEGVEPLTDPEMTTVEADRYNGTRTTPNKHRLASDQRYNSLGQLTRSSMPDRDNMSIFETHTTTGLPAHLKVSTVQFLNTNLGYLGGWYTSGAGIERGLLYRTTDGGNSWTRREDLIASDLRDVHFPTELNGWAVGNDGVVLKTVDGGTSWDLQGPTTQALYTALNAVHFRTDQEGLLGGEGQRLHYTTNGGTTYTNYLSTLSFDRVNDLAFDASQATDQTDRYWAALTTAGGTLGALMRNEVQSLGTANAWVLVDEVVSTLDHNCLSLASGNVAFVAGEDGLLFKSTDGGRNWTMINTGTLAPFTDIEFLDENVGMALIDVVGDNPDLGPVLHATWDGGQTWTIQGEAPMPFRSLRTYMGTGTDLRVYGQRSTGQVAVLSMTPSEQTVFVTDVATPVTDPDAFWVGPYQTNNADNPDGLVICVMEGTTLYVRTDAFSEDQPWLSQLLVDDEVLGGTPDPFNAAVAMEAKVADTAPLRVMGLILGEHGEVVPFKFDATLPPFIDLPAADHTYSDVKRLEPDVSAGHIYAIAHNTGTQAIAVQRYTVDPLAALPPTVLGINTPGWSAVNGVDDAMVTTITAGGSYTALTLSGQNGFLSLAYDLTAAPCTLEVVSDDVKPLPLRGVAFAPDGDMAAVGDKGMVLKQVAGNTLRLMGFRQLGNINAVVYDATGNRFRMCGDDGYLHSMSADANYIVPLTNKTTFSGNYLALTAKANNVYFGADNGSLVRTNNAGTGLIERPYVMGALRGVAPRLVAGNVAEIVGVGDDGHIHRMAESVRVRVRDIYMPRLRDVHFLDELNGAVLADKLAVRYTGDGTASWKVGKHPTIGTAATYNSIITTSSTLFTVFGHNSGNGSLVRYVSGTGTGYGGVVLNGAPIYNACAGPNGLVYVVGHNGANNSKCNTYNPAIALNSSVKQQYPIVLNSSTHKAIWRFNDANPGILVTGHPGQSKLDVPTAWTNAAGTQSAVTFNGIATTERIVDLHFIDAYNGFAITSTGKLFRTTSANAAHTSFTWTELTSGAPPPLLDHLEQQTDIAKYKVRAIAFNTRTRGFVGGEYQAPPAGVPNRYARTINDETGLYSQRMWYDGAGRLVLSQDSKQQAEYTTGTVKQRFSYTLYDDLGRVVEAGEVEESSATNAMRYQEIFGTFIGDQWEARLVNNDKLALFVGGNKRYERIRTWYDANPFAAAISSVLVPEHLDRRVAATAIYDVFEPANEQDDDFDQASHYSYDIHGNVKELVQDIPELATVSGDAGQRYKRIAYDYDLISGNVKQVDYQDDAPDQYHHRYSYDADNRIKDVHTSRNGDYWERDARYFYYAHGPLARTELGENEVQGLDYAYTLQGWLKAMNGDALTDGRDMGYDGVEYNGGLPDENSHFGRDAYGFSLGYYEGDYTPIDATRWTNTNRPIASTVGAFADTGVRKDLFNGNISHTVSTLPVANAVAPLQYDDGALAMVYRYDQLNRLKSNVGYTNVVQSPTQFYWQANNDQPGRHASTFTYDRNGNITGLTRNRGDAQPYDALSYHYHKVNGKVVQNRLYHWDDGQADANRMTPAMHGSEDLEPNGQAFVDNTDATVVNNPANNNHNYYYDRNGNLKKDRTADIDAITWTPRGKVGAVTRSGASTLADLGFAYDASGQRRVKYLNSDADQFTDVYEHYVRDAQGNVMAMYKSTVDDAQNTVMYRLMERPRYGSERIGNDEEVVDPLVPASNPAQHLLAKMRYELTDHLGNVHAIVTDRKRGVNLFADPDIEYYGADLLNAMDYEPYGSFMAGRKYTSKFYRYGFDGMEYADDLYGEGLAYTTEFRQYDPRLGRWLSIDPSVARQPWQSPYAAFDNSPIWKNDPQGNIAPIVIWALKKLGEAAVYVVTDVAIQAAIEHYFGGKEWQDVKIDWWAAIGSGGEAFIPGKKAQVIFSAGWDMLTYTLEAEEWEVEEFVKSGVKGGISSIIGDKAGDILKKYGPIAFSKGMRMLGFDRKEIRALTGSYNLPKHLEDRVKLRVGTKNAVFARTGVTEVNGKLHWVGPDGKAILGDKKVWDPTRKTYVYGDFDFSHAKGHKWSDYQDDPSNWDKTREQVIEDQNNPDLYVIESSKANRSAGARGEY